MNSKSFDDMYHSVVDNGYDFGTGTWAVISDKIQMKLNKYGELHPILSRNSTFSENEIKLLRESCLSLSSKNEDDISKKLFSKVPGIEYSKRLGYYSELLVGHVAEGNYRVQGSSGGFGTWVLSNLLKENLVDYVIQVRPSNDSERLFEYAISNSVEEVFEGAKTKYYPVEYSNVIRKMKSRPGRYAIIGLPSYIMEIRLLAENDPTVKERLKYAVGLICGHQKSTKFAEFLAWQCGIKPGNLEDIEFRKKMKNRPSSEYAIVVRGKIDGKQVVVTREMKELIGSDWGQGFFKVRASDFTDDVMNETADITLGDAWLPEYTNDSGGNNVVIVRNPAIRSIIDEGIRTGKLKVDKVDEETIYKSQASHFRHTRIELKYRLSKNKHNGIWTPKKRVEASDNLPWIRKKIQDKREEICLEVPKLYETAVKEDDLGSFLKSSGKLSKSYKNLYRVQRILDRFVKLLR